MVPKGKALSDIETARAIDAALEPQDDTITLSSGVVLRGKKTNPAILIQVMAAIPRPEPPMYMNDKMGREMENPDDPNYIERLQAWKIEYSDRVVTAMISLGTELVFAPKELGNPNIHEQPTPPVVKGKEKTDDKEYLKRLQTWRQEIAWLKDYSLLGMPMIPEHEGWRYLTWVKFKAVQDESDMQKIMEVVGRLNGIRESSVKSAENFPGSDQADR